MSCRYPAINSSLVSAFGPSILPRILISLIPSSSTTHFTPGRLKTSRSKRASALVPAPSRSTWFPEIPSFTTATFCVAVVNEGISGNQVLRDGAGTSALARFDRDVLSRPGVKWVVLLEGINDINIRGRIDGPNALTSEELIAGYRQLIERSH